MKRVFLLFHLAALIPLDNTLTLQVERGKRQTTCPTNEYQCKNNECIKRDLICDGGKDCSDGSDETKELCKTPCSGNSFTCDYGGCIDNGLRCNGVSDCVDGSDESSRLCDTPTSTSTSRPPTTPTPGPLIPVTQGGRPCQLPSNPPNGIIENVCKSCVNVNHYGEIRLKCNEGYTPEKEGYAFCRDSQFTASLTCKPIRCHPVESLSTITICYRNGTKLDSCKQENLIPDTTVNYRCRYGYQLNDQPIEYQNSECFLSGEKEAVWHPEIFHCVPECGLSPPKGTGLIWKPAIPIEHPWHCGVFKNENNLFEQICGGTLVSGYFVLSAAHCFTEPNKPELYRVIFGKIHRSYGIHDQTQREYQIKKIIIHEHFTDVVYEDDIAFIVLKQEVQFSATVMPACIDFQRKHFDLLLSAGSKGQVAGWGFTNNDKPSPILQYTDLEYHNFKECHDKAAEHYKKFNTKRKFCAGTIGGSAVCAGDTGGGLLFKATEGPPNWYLMGIVNVGPSTENNSCVRTQYPLFTSIRNQLEFINNEFNQNAKLTYKDVEDKGIIKDEQCENGLNNVYKCKNNECINRDLICDGGKDCSDGSDETKELCKTPCIGNSFTCYYGGCIDNGLRCNGVPDCVDGSDEFSRLCDTPTSTSTSRPPTTPTPSPLIPVTQGGRPCQLPSNPPNGIIENQCKSCETVNHYGAITLKCNAGYTPEKDSYSICINSKFPSNLTCKPIYCPPVESLSSITICYRNGNKLDSCKQENLIPDTSVNYMCRYGYQLYDQPIENQNSSCILKGEREAVWQPEIFYCVPECGLSPPKGTGLIYDGKPAIPVEHPWHCGVFKNENNLFGQICGGTLVSGYFVLSAAHCFTEPNKTELYRIIFGKIHRSYGIHDPTQNEYQIQKIINNDFFTYDVYEDDIAFIVLQQEVQFSATLMPACIDFQRKHFDILLSPGSRGQVAGWGLTNNEEPSPTLQYTNLEYHNIEECRINAIGDYIKLNTKRKFCAGTVGGSTVCKGDSGGGLMFKATQGPQNWYLMGIVSAGLRFMNGSCARTQYPVFTNIKHELEFINKEFTQNNKLTFKGI